MGRPSEGQRAGKQQTGHRAGEVTHRIGGPHGPKVQASEEHLPAGRLDQGFEQEPGGEQHTDTSFGTRR